MRRAFAIALLIALGSPLALALFPSSAASLTLPACCRRNGMHHCTSPVSSSPGLSSQPCTQYPTNATPVRLSAGIAPPQASFVASEPDHASSAAVGSFRVATHHEVSAHPKRGPPAFAL